MLKCGKNGVLTSLVTAKKNFICGIQVFENETYEIAKLHYEHPEYSENTKYRIWDINRNKGLLSSEIANSTEYFVEIED